MNSVPYDGRPACNNCGFCAYYGCPIEAKGDPIAPLRNALRTGRCDIRVDSYVERVLLDAAGKQARGVRYLDIDGNTHEVSARVVVVAGGAWETPRLLLRSEIANSSGLVGRYLMYHFQTFVIGQFPFRLHGHRGRSVTHLHDDHMIIDDDVRAFAREHGLPYFRGGLTEHGGGGSPVMEGIYTAPGITHTPRDARLRRCATGCGRSPCRAKTSRRRRTASISIRRCATCTASPPGARRTTCTRTKSSRRATTRRGSKAIMREAGAESTFAATSPPLEGDRAGTRSASMSRHIMGTCRMGDDPGDERRRPRGSGSTTSRTWSAPTRRCSRPRPATARRSRSSRSRPAGVSRPRGPAEADQHSPARPDSRLGYMDLAALSDTTLADATGTKHRLGDLWDDKPIVLVFLRHFGCLHCREHAAQLRERYDDISRPAATSSRSAPATSATPRRSPRDEQIPFLVLVDDDADAAQRGIAEDAQLVPAAAPAYVEGNLADVAARPPRAQAR